MKHLTGVATSQLLFVAIISFALIGFFMVMPTRASADTISGQTTQLLPPGGNSCPQVTASHFTPFVYGDTLHSFEFTISDPSYVALIGSVGGRPISFQYMTRHFDASGVMRIHVDIDPVVVTGTLPISVTLVSGKGAGQPTCAEIVSASIGSGATQTVATNAGTAGGTVSTRTTPSATASNAASAGTPAGMTATRYGAYEKSTSIATAAKKPADDNEAAQGTTIPATTANGTATGRIAAAAQGLQNMCVSPTSVVGLWLVLLVLYALFVSALIWASWPASWSWIRTPEWLTAGVVIPLIALLAFWYSVASCRGAWWLPVATIAVAVAGLFAAFWNDPRVQQHLLIEQKKL